MKESGKTNRGTEALASSIVKEEMNLVEFPFTVLSHRISKDQKTFEVSQKVRSRSGRLINQRWIVTGSDKFGLPLATDNDIYLALMQIYKEDDFKDRKIHFTRYQLLKIMGSEPTKRRYNMIGNALDRLISVVVKSENAFWDHEAKAHVTKAFHLFESYDIYDERERIQNSDQPELPLSNIVMSEFLFNSIKSSYIKNLDIGFYFTLQTPLTKRLYRFLDKKRYHRSSFQIELTRLSALLPLQDQYPSQIKRRLEKAHKELIEKEYLAKVSYERDPKDCQEIVTYLFEMQELQEQPKEIKPKHSDQSQCEEMLQELINRGITKTAARHLVKKYPAKQIEGQVASFDWLVDQKSPLIGKNPAGFLRKSIEENYEPPTGYTEDKNREELKIAQQQKKEEEAREQKRLNEIQEKVDKYRETLSEEESQKLRAEATALIQNDGNIKKEFVTDILIRAKEGEIIRKRLNLSIQ
jgi:plasmid replication initiation protein